MVEMMWEISVKEQARGQFELAYGPGGAWSKLFGRCAGFRGITLLRDANNSQRYVAIEIWDAEEQRAQALVERDAEHATLIASLSEWVEAINELGTFRLLAEGTVRVRSGSRRGDRRANR